MKSHELTNRTRLAKDLPMDFGKPGKRRSGQRGIGLAMLMGSVLALGGCVSVKAPDKPIVIELNIDIKQDVVYRLAADAKNTIGENSGIF